MKTVLFALVSIIIAGCAVPTQFVSRGTDVYGYEDQKIDDATYRVVYTVNENTGHDRVKDDFIPLRGGELCKKAKYGYWEIRDFKQEGSNPNSYSAMAKCFKAMDDAKPDARYTPVDFGNLRLRCYIIPPFMEEVAEDAKRPSLKPAETE
jgi:hypothetical protein